MFGETYSSDGDVGHQYGNDWQSNFWILKLDGNGDILWSTVVGGSQDELAHGLAAAPGGGCYIVGASFSSDYDCTCLHDRTGNYSDAYVARISGNGDLQWRRCLGNKYGTFGLGAGESLKGGVLVAAYAVEKGGDVSHHIGESDFWAIELDSNGHLEWENCFGSPRNHELPYDICQGVDGSVWIAGAAGNNSTPYLPEGDIDTIYGKGDAWVVHTDSRGNLLSATVLGGPASDRAEFIHPLPDGSVFVGGTYRGKGPEGGPIPSVYEGGETDIFLARLAPWTTGINNAGAIDRRSPITISPNPGREQVTIRVHHPGMMRITDITGRQIFSARVREGMNTRVPVGDWSRGIYHVSVQYDRGGKAIERLVVN